jgi:hypothetical protein
MPFTLPENSYPPGHSSTKKSPVPCPEYADAEQRRPGSDRILLQQTRDPYVIYDMSSGLDCNAIASNNQDVMKMLDDLEDELSSIRDTIQGGACSNGKSVGSSPRIESLNTVGQTLLKEAEDGGLQGRSWAMGRWKAELPGSHPWYCAEGVDGRARGASHANASSGTDDQNHKGANGYAGVVEHDEDKWSNVATAADSDMDVEEKPAVATAN